MLKKLMLTAAAFLLSGVALAQSNNPSCVLNPADPDCLCMAGETDGDCTFGVHRGLVASTVIHDSAVGLAWDHAAAPLHLSH
jgi:hypothetical protein